MQKLHESSDDYNPHSCSLSEGNPCDPCSQLVDLNIEIALLERQLADLFQKRVSLKTKINYHHDCLIHRFPPEIASHVFAFYLERIHSPVHFSLESRKAPPGPLLLSGVCSKWKQIVHSTPHLWTWVHIYMDHCYTTPLDKVRQRLRRSGQHPLTISLFCGSFATHSAKPSEVINFLKDLAPRWSDLNLTMNHSFYSTLFDSIVESPHLEKLYIQSQSEGDSEFYPSFKLCNTPRLREVQLTGVYFTNVGIQWHSLTRISVQGFSMDEIIEVMRQAPILSRFEILKYGEVENLFPLPPTPFVHRAIRYLILTLSSFDKDYDVLPLFDLISLPQLEGFTYSARVYNHKIPTGHLISAFNRFECHLTDLTVTDLYDEEFFMDHNLIHLLSNLSTLTRLSLQVSVNPFPRPKSGTDLLLRCLSRARDGGMENTHVPFLPLLKVLKLRRCSISWVDFANIFDVDDSEDLANSDGELITGGPLELEIPLNSKRPLHETCVDLLFRKPRDGVAYIDKEVLPRLVRATQNGIILAIRDCETRDDLLQESIAYYSQNGS